MPKMVLFCVLWSAWILPTASAQVTELRPGELRRFEGAAGTVTELAFDVEADQFVHLEVLQGGADVAATLIDPAGAVVREVDVTETGVIEPISWTRSQAGRYRLRVRVEKTMEGGFFDVLLDPPRPAADSDEEWLRCERTYVEALGPASTPAERAAITRALRRLLADWRALGDERWAALTQLQLGVTNYEGDSERGADDCLEAADYAERSGDLTLENAYACAAVHLISLGFLEDAIPIAEQQLARLEQADDDRGAVRMARLNLGLHQLSAGRTSEAARHLTQALQEAEASGDGTVQAYAHAHLGRLHRDRGEYQQALDHYARSLAIPHPYHVIRPLHRAALASVQLAIGDLDAALASAQRAVAETRNQGGARGESAALETLGRVHVERGEVDQAIALLSSNVALCRRKNMFLSEVDGLVALGRAEAARGRRSVARQHQEDALARSRAQGYRVGEALALAALCALEDAQGLSGTACEDALSNAQAIGHGPVALVSRFHLARAARRRGALEVARAQLEEALKMVDAQRLELRRSDLRQTFSATVDDIEDEYVDVLVDLATTDPNGGWDVRAFEASERSRGRSLRDELAESRLGIRQGADAVLLHEEDALRDRLRAALARQLRGDVAADAARELERTIGDLQARLAEVAARIRDASPRYAALSQPEQPSLDAIRAALLDDQTVLLYYALGERRSTLWVVTRTTFERHLLPARHAIERLARPAVAALSTARTTGAALAPLGRVLLAPAAARLDVPRVVVVADGVLHYVPFAALPSPRAAEPLLKRSEVVHLPSAAAGVLLARTPARSGTGEVAVFADPVFRSDDERLRGRSAAIPPAKMASLPRELTRGRAGLARLPFTRLEARAIETLAGAGGRISLDFDASRATALDERMASYRIVHFATHGLLNAARPELSGIVLSLVDRDGRPQDGFLTSLDTFNLRLDADLVVLSGCRTALGKDVRSEGIVGLTRGFMYAGTRGVLASLWPVDDAATAELMRAFYEGLLGPRKLLPPAALRAAQLHVRADPRWRAPYYWAAFQLQGVWAHPRN